MSKSPVPEGMTVESAFDSRDYEISSATNSRMHNQVNYTQGILLTQIEAFLGDDIRSRGFKNLLKRELQRMATYIQDAIYQERGIQERVVGQPLEPIEDIEE